MLKSHIVEWLCGLWLAYHTHTGYHRDHADPVDHIHSLVINMAINPYPTVTGGATTQYDQKIVRLISRSNASLVTCVIYRGREVQSRMRDLGERRTYLGQRQGRRR